MTKHLLILLILISQSSFSQTEKDNYEMYSLILTERLELGIGSKKDTIVLIEQFMDEFDSDHQIFEQNKEVITKSDLSLLYSMTYKDTTFLKRISKEKYLIDIITELTYSEFKNPIINVELLRSSLLDIESITDKKYNSFFGRFKSLRGGWKRIEKKYGTDKVVEFSKVHYKGNFASTYYGLYCGSLCGSGNIVIFEKVNGIWEILTEINLWVS